RSSDLCFVCIVGYDFILALFGREVDFYQNRNTFIYYNLVFFIEFMALVSAAFMLKRMVDQSDNKNLELFKTLETTNRELIQQNYQLALVNQEKEAQNEEMSSQAEELRANQEKLADAYDVIQKQKE